MATLSRFLCVGTFICPRCGTPCYSNCCGTTTASAIQGFGPDLHEPQPCKKRKKSISKDMKPPTMNATAEISAMPEVNDKEQTMGFVEPMPANEVAYDHGMPEGTLTDGAQVASDISKFLSRPINIFRLQWTPGVAIPAFKFSPWVEFLTQGRVREKLATFKLLRATLKVQIVINGSPFHFGRMFVGMKPGDATSTNNTWNLTPDSNKAVQNWEGNAIKLFWEPNKTFYSQRPHVLLNPNTNMPAMFTWPMFFGRPYIDLTDLVNEAGRMGFFEVWEMSRLQHAADQVDPIGITFFAWLEDVELTGATPNSTATADRGSEQEYSRKGLVSGPATALAEFAGRFTDFSFIGPYARATQIGSLAVGTIASIFGFSKPADVEGECVITSMQAGRMPNTSGMAPLVKLTFDPKQELSIDPRLLDLPENDEMSFACIAQREALFYQTVWSDSTAGRIVGFALHPMMGPRHIQDGVTCVNLTPMGFVAAPFDYWRGSIIVRLQIVASKMHRGRIAVVYTPEANGTLPSISIDSIDLNSHFVEIIDLSEVTDGSYEIKWSQAQMWRQIKAIYATGTAETVDLTEPNGAITLENDYCNGRIDLYVVNRLALANTTTTSVDINIYVRAGEDFQVVNPTHLLQQYSFVPSGGGTYPLPDATASRVDPNMVPSNEEDACCQTQAIVLNPTASDISARALYSTYIGEQLQSIRALVKRYQPYHVIEEFGGGVNTAAVLKGRQYPLFPFGRALGAYGSSGLDQYLNICNVWQTYLRWFAQGYVGYKGSVRYLVTAPGYGARGVWRAVRATHNINNISDQFGSVTSATNPVDSYAAYMGDGVLFTRDATDYNFLAGGQIQSAQESNTFQFEIPWFSQYRFAYIHNTQNQSNPFYRVDNDMLRSFWILADLATTNAASTALAARVYVAGGEDAQFHFFFGVPAAYFLTPPLAATIDPP